MTAEFFCDCWSSANDWKLVQYYQICCNYQGMSVPSCSIYLPLSLVVSPRVRLIISPTASWGDLVGTRMPSVDFFTFCPILVLVNPGCKLTIVKPSSLRSLAKITVSACHQPYSVSTACKSCQATGCGETNSSKQQWEHTLLEVVVPIVPAGKDMMPKTRC